MTPRIKVYISRVTQIAEAVNLYELSGHEETLPGFSAGAHIDVFLSNGLSRSYSLTNPLEVVEGFAPRYQIAVALDPNSTGGSRWIHENLGSGSIIEISHPKNNFPLNETAKHSLLLAGGIGITPIWSMVQRLAQLKRSWRLVYCARDQGRATFFDELRKHPEVTFNFDHTPGGTVLDIAKLVASSPDDAHLYCCGPNSMLASFRDATATFEANKIHLEYFKGSSESATGGFTLILAKSGLEIQVPPGVSILDAVLARGVEVAYTCTEGVCGSCETTVIEGEPEHKDLILSAAEKANGSTMMICCSGSRSSKLVLDL